MKFRATIHKEGVPDTVRTIEAPSRFAVYEQIEKEGGSVVDLAEGGGGFNFSSLFSLNIFGTGIKRPEIIRMARNLSTMLVAGLSLSRALSVIERQSSNKNLKRITTELSADIKKGSSFNESLANHPKIFPKIFVAMVKAGEESGGLPDALTTIALQMDRSEGITRKIKSAMIYPCIIILAIIIVSVLMLIYVVPTLTKTFKDLKVNLPLATRVFVAISDFMVAHALLVFVLLAVLIVGGIMFVRSQRGNTVVLWIGLRAPVVGELIRETFAARASRTISSLLSSGVPILDALAITKEVVHASAFVQVITEAEEHVKKGELLSASFVEHTNLYPILMGDMMAVGEETGKVAEMLKQIAEFYEEDVSEKTKDLSTIVEPVLMLFIGGFVGIFAVAMIAPIYSLSSAI